MKSNLKSKKRRVFNHMKDIKRLPLEEIKIGLKVLRILSNSPYLLEITR
jgi:hypothetical protein